MVSDTLDIQEFTALIEEALPVAEKMLGENGSFLPYGAVLYADGEIQHLRVDPSSETQDIQHIISALEQSFSDLAGQAEKRVMATVLCMDIKMTPALESDEDSENVIERITPGGDRKDSIPPAEPDDLEGQGNVDCIMLRLKSDDGQALNAFRPYAIDQSGYVRFSTMFATKPDAEKI